MAKKLFRDGTEIVPFYVRAISSGPFVFVSGTTSLDAKGRVRGKDAAEQTKITMRKIEAALTSEAFREVVADFDRRWPSGVTRTREIVTLVQELSAP